MLDFPKHCLLQKCLSEFFKLQKGLKNALLQFEHWTSKTFFVLPRLDKLEHSTVQK
jgi:hypothetical protein